MIKNIVMNPGDQGHPSRQVYKLHPPPSSTKLTDFCNNPLLLAREVLCQTPAQSSHCAAAALRLCRASLLPSWKTKKVA